MPQRFLARSLGRPVAALAALLALAACNNATTAAGSHPTSSVPAAEDPSTVVATIGSEKVTLGELDKTMKGKLLALEQEAREQKHKLRQAGLEAMLMKRLMEAESKKRGLTEEQLLKLEVEDKVGPVSEEEARAFYEANQAKMPGPFEMMAGQIQGFLQNEKKKKLFYDYFEQKKAEANVKMLLAEPEPPVVEVAAEGPAKGAPNAPVTIVLFSDFQCPYCSKVVPIVEQVLAAYPGQVRFVFRDYPLPFHDKAAKAAEAGQCAAEQGKFWELHDHMFAHQDKLDPADLKGAVAGLGIDAAKFAECLDSGRMAAVVKKSTEAGEEAGVSGTPAFFINGRFMAGALPLEEFRRVIDQELAKKGLGAQVKAPVPAQN